MNIPSRGRICGLLLILLLPALLRGADDLVPPQVDSAIGKGLGCLSRQQNPDGSFEGGGPRVALTGLTLMSYLAAGHTPDVGRYGLNVRNAVDFLVKQIPDDGYLGRVDGSRMYGQGIVTLALAEACGVERDPQKQKKMLAAVQRAIKVILKAQDVKKDEVHAGGWRYEPESGDSDLSLSGWNALALRAARNIGLDVPKDRAARAVQYVLRCYRADQKGFAYQVGQDSTTAMTSVGMLNLYLMDAADRPETAAAGKFLAEHLPNPETRFYYYAMYYSAQAGFQAGDSLWPAVWKIAREQLLSTQMPDGGWPASRTGEEPGRVYATSMSVLTLTVPYRLLPTYQR